MRLMKRLSLGICAVVVLGGALPVFATEPAALNAAIKGHDRFYLKNGDRVVFYGDSITDQRKYTNYIETYCVTRFPDNHFTFIHSGWGGDRVTGGGGGPIELRLKRDVIAYKPTVVTICLGMNDGSYRAFDKGIFDTYINGYRSIIETLKKELPGVRLTLLTAPAYDDVTRAPTFPGGYNDVLVQYGKAVTDLAKEYKLTLADTNAPLVETLEKAKAVDPELAAKIIPDRVHPDNGGHMVMAAAVLRAWKAPSAVAEIELIPSQRRVGRLVNSRVTKLTGDERDFSFTFKDKVLPWPLPREPKNIDMLLALEVTNADKEFNQFRLKVIGLPAGKYQIKEEGNVIFETDNVALEAGLNLASIPALLENVQARHVLESTNKHNELHFKRWRNLQVPAEKSKDGLTEEVKKQMESLDSQDEDMVKQQLSFVHPSERKIEIVKMVQ